MSDHKQSLPSSAPNTQPGSILIVTVTKVEAQAVLKVFSGAANMEWTRQAIGNKTYYNLGVHGGAPVFMVQSEMGTATPGGALLTVSQAIWDLCPQAVIMCGIAFGLCPDKQKLGDILVAKQLLYYEPQKVDFQRGQVPRGDRTTCAERLLDRFRSGDIDWHGAPRHFGLVLSGEKLVNDPAFRDWLLKTEPEAVGGEMEGAGLYAAARAAKVDWILVKAICDWADGTKNNDAQPLAARNAAEFVLHVLQLEEPLPQPSDHQYRSLPFEMGMHFVVNECSWWEQKRPSSDRVEGQVKFVPIKPNRKEVIALLGKPPQPSFSVTSDTDGNLKIKLPRSEDWKPVSRPGIRLRESKETEWVFRRYAPSQFMKLQALGNAVLLFDDKLVKTAWLIERNHEMDLHQQYYVLVLASSA
jgi:nucleoside phosphorylase